MIHLHNMTIARLSQQALIDPYLVPVQYSQIPGSSPLFYNHQTNQFFPAINCVQTNIPVFQYHPNYMIPPGSINNSIKELSEENAAQASVDHPPNAINVQPVIIRPSFTCSRSSRSQLGINKRRRYRNIPTQQQVIMQYPPSVHLPNSPNAVYGPIVPAHSTTATNTTTSSNSGGGGNSSSSNTTTAVAAGVCVTEHKGSTVSHHHVTVNAGDESLSSSTSPKSSGNATPNNGSSKQLLQSHINIQQTNGANNVTSNSRTFYEIL